MKSLILSLMMVGSCGFDKQAKSSEPATTRKVVLVGDSITKDWPIDVLESNWQSIAVYGLISRQLLDRFEGDIIDGRAEIVIIAVGVNDVYHKVPLGNTMTNINEMVLIAREMNIIPLIATILPVSEDRALERPMEKIIELNEKIKEYCLQNDVRVVDYFPGFLDSDGFVKEPLVYDGLHPNHEGYEVMKPVLYDSLRGL